jgi:hypothetical protein
MSELRVLGFMELWKNFSDRKVQLHYLEKPGKTSVLVGILNVFLITKK